VLLLAACAQQPTSPAPQGWADYDSVRALREDASLVVAGVAQRFTGEGDDRLCQFSVTDTLAGAAPAEGTTWVSIDPDTPIDLQPGFRYVLYLEQDEGAASYSIVGPGVFERSPGDSDFRRLPEAPDGLPAAVTLAQLTEP
jgi:hypothetical protein